MAGKKTNDEQHNGGEDLAGRYQFMENLLKSIPVPMFYMDKTGKYVGFNDPFGDFSGWTREQVIGKTVFDLDPPNTAKIHAQDDERIFQGLDVTQEFEREIVTAKGENKTVLITKSAIYDSNNNVDGLIGVLTDITARKKAEAEIVKSEHRLREIIDLVPHFIFAKDKDGKFVLVNKAVADNYGTTVEGLTGKRDQDFAKSMEEVQHFLEDDQQVIRSGEPKIIPEEIITDANGETRFLTTHKIPFTQYGLGSDCVLGVSVDITERKKFEIELTNAKEKAEETDRLKTAFLNNISHEVRTPLNAILGFASLLGENLTTEEREHFVSIIKTNATELLKIIDDVLELSRLEAERVSVHHTSFSLAELLDDVHHSLRAPDVAQGIRFIRVPLDEDIPEMIVADRGKIRQVLFCFVTNAFKYTQEGTIELGCSIQNEQLRFYVRDTGIGVRNEDKPHIFDRFFRAVDAQKRAIRGTGLGLSIAKELVEIMGGTINVESEPGKGSEFYFLLPFVSAPDARKTAISKKPVPDLSHATILIAEDDENSYEYLNALLRKKVNRLFRVKNGDDLLLFLHNVTPDIILMDLVMPVLDGFEASKRIRKIHPRLPIIAITAYTEPEQQKLAIEAGCDYFMSKPINSEDLLELLGRITGRSISS